MAMEEDFDIVIVREPNKNFVRGGSCNGSNGCSDPISQQRDRGLEGGGERRTPVR